MVTFTITCPLSGLKDLLPVPKERAWFRAKAGLPKEEVTPQPLQGMVSGGGQPIHGSLGPQRDFVAEAAQRRQDDARDVNASVGFGYGDRGFAREVHSATDTAAITLTKGAIMVEKGWIAPMKGVACAVLATIEDTAKLIGELASDPLGTPIRIGKDTYTAVTTLPQWGPKAASEFVQVMKGDDNVAKGKLLAQIFFLAIPGDGEAAAASLAKVSNEIHVALEAGEDAMAVARTFVKQEERLVKFASDGRTLEIVNGAKMAEADVEAAAARLVKAAGEAPAGVTGSWVVEPTKGWKPRAVAYQQQVTGQVAGLAYKVNDVRFDGIVNGVLVDAKGPGYAAQFPYRYLDPKIAKTARHQLAAVPKGTPITWYIAEEGAIDDIRRVFRVNGISGINLVHLRPIP